MNNLKNKVQLIGNLGADPEIKKLDSGKTVSRLSLATNDHYRTEDGKRVTDTQWHQVVVWGNLNNVVEKYLKKGSEILITGKLNYRNYEDKNGNKKYVTEIIADELLMLNVVSKEETANA